MNKSDEVALVLTAKRVALLFALVILIILPAGYFSLKYSNRCEHVESVADIKAQAVSSLIRANPDLWLYQSQRLEDVMRLYPVKLEEDRVTLRDSVGNSYASWGVTPDAPVVIRSSPLYDSERVVGYVEIAHSYRDVIAGTLGVGLLGLLLGTMVYFALQTLPLRAVRALRRLNKELVEGQEARRESEERYSTLVEWTPEPIVVHRDGQILFVNPAAIKLFGARSASDLAGKPVLDLVHAEFHQSWLERLKIIVDHSADLPMMERRLLRLDGTAIEAETKGTLIVYDGIPAIHLAIRDITDRKRYAEELQRLNLELEQRIQQRTQELQVANSELEAFSYSVSHDLRAPLRAIHGFSCLVEQQYAGQIDEQGRDMLRRVGAGVNKMGALIDDLLRLSRISRQTMRIQPVDLSGLAWEVIGELQDGAPERKVEWVIAAQLPAKGDPGLLRIVLQNLIGNAWKYSSKRADARIEVSLTAWRGRPAYFVRDNGAGFDMAYADKLFGAFQRLHSQGEFPGTGIGLATVKRIIYRHGGDVGAESKLGEGATFHFTL